MAAVVDILRAAISGLAIGLREYLTQRPELYSPKHNPFSALRR